MRHVKRYAKLGRDTAHRRSMLRNLTTQFFIHGYIKTTVTRAKAVQPIIERCITYAIKAHQGDLKSYRKFTQYLHPTSHTLKVYRYLADHTDNHQGGKTSLKKLGIHRMGDGAPMALLHLLTATPVSPSPLPPNSTTNQSDLIDTQQAIALISHNTDTSANREDEDEDEDDEDNVVDTAAEENNENNGNIEAKTNDSNTTTTMPT